MFTIAQLSIMKSLRIAFVIVLVTVLIVSISPYSIAETEPPSNREWLEALLKEEYQEFNDSNFIFYFTGHHGLIWSAISLDSIGLKIYNGTTRQIQPTPVILDTLKFQEKNIATIKWGFDTLANEVELLQPHKREIYSPFYNVLYIVKDNEIVFKLDDDTDYFEGVNNSDFIFNLNKLVYLMYWIASPSIRPLIPEP